MHISSFHEMMKPFRCDICGVKFSQKGHLKNHIASIHEKKKTFTCEICDKAFSRKGSMKRHIKLIHEEKKESKLTWKKKKQILDRISINQYCGTLKSRITFVWQHFEKQMCGCIKNCFVTVNFLIHEDSLQYFPICLSVNLNEKLTHYFNFGMDYQPLCNIDVTPVDLRLRLVLLESVASSKKNEVFAIAVNC